MGKYAKQSFNNVEHPSFYQKLSHPSSSSLTSIPTFGAVLESSQKETNVVSLPVSLVQQ